MGDVADWIEAVAPGYRAVSAALPPLKRGANPWVKHTEATRALCQRIVTHSNAELRAIGCRSADSLPCSEACRACVILASEAAQ